jgi:hypothetical protein
MTLFHKQYILCLLCAISSTYLMQAQNLPAEMSLSADGRYLYTGKQPATGLYDSTLIREVYLQFPQSNYWTLLTNNYSSHTDLLANMTVDGILYDSVGVRFKGATSYSQVSSQKKSFNISLDYAHPNQDIMGYQTLNLNNAFLDESFIREVFYLHQIRRHIPAAKGNYTHLFINGQDWGLYPNVQQINKDFLKEWFLTNNGINWRADRPTGSGGGGPGGGGGWGDGTAAINYLGADTATYKQYYTLKSSGINNPWTALVSACNALNNTSAANLLSVLPNYIDIDRTLWFLASEVAFADDDSYIYKGKMDYYAYIDAETNRLTPLEYDGNTVIDPAHATWSAFYNSTNANYPLLNKILAVPQWRQRYLAHLRTIIAEELNSTTCNAMIDNYAAQINALVQSDPKKIYTYTQFQNEIPILKNFITSRRNSLLANTEVAQVAPSISNVAYSTVAGAWTPPNETQTAQVTAQVSSSNGIYQVTLYYANGLAGNFTPVTMYDDGAHQDGAAADGIYGGTIPAQTAGSWVRFYVEATANNTAKSAAYYPVGAEHDVLIYIVPAQLAQASDVVINEVGASNATTMADEAGEYDDWIELYNKSANAIDISGYYLTDNPVNLDKWAIPTGTVMPPYSYMVFWADEDSSQGPRHCNFKISASGETIMLINSNIQIADSVILGQQATDMGYARVPNGTGNFVIQAPTFAASNEVSAPVGIRAYAKLLLQGTYSPISGVMGTTLNPILPNMQPYNTAPWNYGGNENGSNINSKIVDWVLVEARSTANGLPMERRAAYLRDDGMLISPYDGLEGLVFANLTNGNSYYLVVRHRNHLAAMSSSAVTLPNSSATAWDFSNNNNVYGTNQVAQMSDGKYALFAGDINANGVVTVIDYNLYYSQLGSTPNLYLSGDCNLDKNITVDDFNLYQFNAAVIGIPEIRY